MLTKADHFFFAVVSNVGPYMNQVKSQVTIVWKGKKWEKLAEISTLVLSKQEFQALSVSPSIDTRHGIVTAAISTN